MSATSAPRSARAIAVAAPIPRLPPVTSTFLPVSSFMSSSPGDPNAAVLAGMRPEILASFSRETSMSQNR
ncbi:hypothetical protein [Kribbella turkmenica]|uniref:hypothetical protein n=1 Tax=Kribbella turkmenica TaxID=2530375 RepID=UPI001F3636F1|nr:hypothetical protein [Kribbella turkmenica]